MVSRDDVTLPALRLFAAQLWPTEAAGKKPSQHYLRGLDKQPEHQRFSEIDGADDTYV